MRSRTRAGRRLRTTVDALPRHTREAMLRGIDTNRIVVGAYTLRDGGICPMLAAHRNGGRTNFASFARAWDDFTGVTKRPRRATRREVRTLRSYLELSLLADDGAPSLVEAAKEIRGERRALAQREPTPRPSRPAAQDRFRVWDLRGRRRRKRELDLYEATYAAGLQDAEPSSGDGSRIPV